MVNQKVVIAETNHSEYEMLSPEVWEIGYLNRMVQAQEQAEQAKRAAEAKERARLEMAREKARQAQIASIKEVAAHAFLLVAGSACLILMAHTGAVAGWVMQLGTAALACDFGYVVGKNESA